MKIISPNVHALLDYVTVIFLLASPAIFDMEEPLSTFTYMLAGIHFILTILTDYKFGLIKVIPFKIHGLIEVIVAVGLAVIAFWFNDYEYDLGYYFYLSLAVIFMIVFVLTDFLSLKVYRR